MAAPARRVRFVAGNVPHGARRVQDSFNPAAKPESGFGLCLPERLQHAQNGRPVHFVHRQGAQWLGINGKRHLPLGAVLLVAPFGRLGREQSVRALAECRLCRRCHAGFALRLDGVFPLRDDLAGFVSLLTSFGESGSVSAQPHFRDPAATGEPEDPLASARR